MPVSAMQAGGQTGFQVTAQSGPDLVTTGGRQGEDSRTVY